MENENKDSVSCKPWFTRKSETENLNTNKDMVNAGENVLLVYQRNQ